MRSALLDPQVLQRVGPIDLTGYLRAGGWSETGRLPGDSATIWTHTNGGGAQFEILVPLDHSLRDYAARVAEALATLEVVEDRSPADVLADVTTASADIVRIPLTAAGSSDGTIPIEHGGRVVQHARDMMLAAACAAVERRTCFPSRKPPQATEYVRKVRLGQAERGGYVVALHSRVPPALRSQGVGAEVADAEDEPYERLVTRTLARSLAAARTAAEKAVATADLGAFEEAVRSGVSANLCDAISGIGGPEPPSDVVVTLTWAKTRPAPARTPGRVVFSADALPVIAEAGRLLKETAPLEVSEVDGFVVHLDHEPDPASPGRITLQGVVEGRLRRIAVELRTEDYQQAVEAHRAFRQVRYQGELVRQGRFLALRNPSMVPCVDQE